LWGPGRNSIDSLQRKQALRLFTYGLHAIGVRRVNQEGDMVNAFLANWLTQVSFDPPLVALSIECDAWSWPLLKTTGVFSINVLATSQRELAGHLGKSRHKVGDKLADLPWRPGTITGCPVLYAHALAVVECRVRAIHPAGDSMLVVAEVVGAEVFREGEPLTMRETGFRHAG
jgi:flavin reductase (DIM6/NTAB) family NADH-FMN oxidoreductase RutF